MTPMTPTPPVPPAAPTPQKPKTAQVIRMTKGLAKPAMAPYFFRIILLLALEALTGYALSMVFAGLAQRLGLSLTVKVWVYAFDLTAALLSLLGNALLLPLTLGVTEFLMKAFRRSGPRVADVFLWYADGVHWKLVLEYYVYAVLIGLIAIPLYAVPANWLMETINAVTTDFGQQMTNGVLSPVIHWSLVNFRAVGVSLLLMLLYAFLSVRLFLTPYYFLDHPEIGPFEAAGRSWRAMRAHTWEFILLILSFIGWFLICTVTMFLTAFYLVPYLRMTLTIYSEYARSADEHSHTVPPADNAAPPEAPSV